MQNKSGEYIQSGVAQAFDLLSELVNDLSYWEEAKDNHDIVNELDEVSTSLEDSKDLILKLMKKHNYR